MKTQHNNTPSKENREYWLFAERKAGSYPTHTQRGGKWLIFVSRNAVDEVWRKIKEAVERGKLGDSLPKFPLRSQTQTLQIHPNM